MCAFTVCLVIGALNKMDWLILLGAGICAVDFIAVGVVYGVYFVRKLNKELAEEAKKERTPEREAELLDEINSATNAEESKIAQAKYYGGGAENAGELIASAFGFSKEGRQAFKEADLREKLKPVAIFVWLGITLITFFVGITLSNIQIQPVGFIVMGAGGGSFFLTIIGFFIYSIGERRTYFRGSKASKKPIKEEPSKNPVRRGVVKRCEIHSQHKTGNRTPKVSGTLYQIWVWTSPDEPLVRLICSRRYEKYEKVRFTERRGIRAKRRIIED